MGRDSEQSCRFKISLGNALESLAGGLKLHALHSAERCHARASFQTPCSELNGRTACEVRVPHQRFSGRTLQPNE